MGATAAKLGFLISPGSSGRPRHAAGMVQRHIWNVPPQSSLCSGISTDGRYISYVDWTTSNIGVRDLFAKESWLVTKNAASTWATMAEASIISPDGTQIAYSGYTYDDICFTPACPADATGDGIVDVLDLLVVIGAWGTSDLAADVNDDGIVDTLDLLAVLDAWGSC